MSKRVYKVLSAKYGISNLQTKRLKLSTVDGLNDPFDLVSVDTTDDRIERAVNETVAGFEGNTALLCFSPDRTWN